MYSTQMSVSAVMRQVWFVLEVLLIVIGRTVNKDALFVLFGDNGGHGGYAIEERHLHRARRGFLRSNLLPQQGLHVNIQCQP